MDLLGLEKDTLAKLDKFNEDHASASVEVKMSSEEQGRLLTTLLNDILTDNSMKSVHRSALCTVKILARNKAVINSVLTSGHLNILLGHAGLFGQPCVRDDKDHRDSEVILEALRCLSNIYLLSSVAQNYALENGTISNVMEQSKRYKDSGLPLQVMSFDMKLLFLITAHKPESRTLINHLFRGLSKILDVLLVILEAAKDRSASNSICLTEDEVIVVNDVLKLLFNLTVDMDAQQVVDDEAKSDLTQISKMLQILLVLPVETEPARRQVVSNSINLLTNIPADYMGPIIGPFDKAFSSSMGRIHEYEGVTINVIQVIVDHLSFALDQQPIQGHFDLRNHLSPVLKVLSCIAKCHVCVRHYLKDVILPPLREADVKKRPEEGDTLRNKMCKLLVHPDMSVSMMTAELLFVLCKENVDRFVKHTGYGNAAGLLARRGLLLGGKTDTVYSDSEDGSDTEDYVKLAHLINPVTGYIQPDKLSSNPLDEMTEEQKEYEAMRLVGLIDRLHSLGVVQPAKVGDKGRPVPVDHILELAENAAAKTSTLHESLASDSDDHDAR